MLVLGWTWVDVGHSRSTTSIIQYSRSKENRTVKTQHPRGTWGETGIISLNFSHCSCIFYTFFSVTLFAFFSESGKHMNHAIICHKQGEIIVVVHHRTQTMKVLTWMLAMVVVVVVTGGDLVPMKVLDDFPTGGYG